MKEVNVNHLTDKLPTHDLEESTKTEESAKTADEDPSKGFVLVAAGKNPRKIRTDTHFEVSAKTADEDPPKVFVLVEEDVAADVAAGKNPRKKSLKDIFDSILVAEALLVLSQGQAPDMQPQAPDMQLKAPITLGDAEIFNPVESAPWSDNEEEVAHPQAGDTVRLLSDDRRFTCYIAKVDRIEGENLICRWYFFPEETREGRLQFHGQTEVFSSDSSTIQSVYTVIGQCTVHTLGEYNELPAASDTDYFCRFHYDNETGSYVPDKTDVFCTCEMPQNPDEVMVQCDTCFDWFHSGCIGLDDEAAKALENYFCHNCV